jgi:hypothetical protein
LDDGTGVIDVRLNEVDPAGLQAFEGDEVKHQMIKNRTSQFQLSREQRLKLVSRKVAMKGTAELSAETGKLQFITNKVTLTSDA